MALGTLPPWLDITPETFLGAMKSGAQLGTQRRGQDIEAGQAADRLRLAYDSLASQERRASESEQMKLELAQNAQELRQSQMDAVNQYKQDQLNQQMQLGQARIGAQTEALQLRQAQGKELSDIREKALKDKEDQMSRGPAAIQLTDEILSSESKANELDAKGNKAAADQLRQRAALLREQTKGQEVVTGYDDQGRPIVKVGKGVGGPTVATQSQAQQKLVKYENSMELINRLNNVMKPEHVGARGVAGEWLVDKGLQQVAEAVGGPDVSSQGRMESRKLMVALREGLMREMNNDNRFSLADREEITKALPSSGVFESFKDAKTALNMVRDIITERSKNYSKAIGQKPPIWTLSPEEIISQFNLHQIDRETAFNALTRFH